MKSSCHALPHLLATAFLSDLALDGFCNPSGNSQPPKHTPHMPWRYTLLSGNLAEIRKAPIMPSKRGDIRDKLGVQIDASVTGLIYSNWNNVARENIPHRIGDISPPSLAQAVLKLRKTLKYSQTQIAQALGVSQGNVAKWESGKLTPPGQILALFAKLAPDDERAWWLRQAGVKIEELGYAESDTRTIPVLKDAAAAGTPRAIDESEVDFKLSLPRTLIPRGGKLIGVRVAGDSMSPILESGYIALIDVTRRDVVQLVDHMVAARDKDDGVTLKWLRKQEPDLYLLVPQNTSPRHPVKIITSESGWSIVGEVVNWIGWPPPPRKKK